METESLPCRVPGGVRYTALLPDSETPPVSQNHCLQMSPAGSQSGLSDPQRLGGLQGTMNYGCVILGWGQRADMCGSYLLGCLRSPLWLSEDPFGLGLFPFFGLMQAQKDC